MNYSNGDDFEPDDFEAEDDFEPDDSFSLVQNTGAAVRKATQVPDWYEPDFSEELERQSEIGKTEAARGIVSGATLGLSEHIPGLKPEDNFAGGAGKAIGSIPLLSKLIGGYQQGGRLITKNAPNFIKKAGDVAATGVAGGTYESAKSFAQGHIPDDQEILKNTLEWAALDAAFKYVAEPAGRFIKGVYDKIKGTKKTPWSEVNDIINKMKSEGEDFSNPERVRAKALSILENQAQSSNKQLKPSSAPEPTKTELQARQTFSQNLAKTSTDLRSKKVEPVINELNKNIPELSEPLLPKNIDAIEIAEANSNEELDYLIDQIAQRPISDQEFGKNIQADLERGLTEAKKEYGPAFDLAEEAAEFINAPAPHFKDTLLPVIEDLESTKTKPQGYDKTIKDAINALEDAGFIVTRNENGQIQDIAESGQKQVSELIKLNKRLKEIVNYDTIDKQVTDRLKPAITALNQDINNGLKTNPEAKVMYEEAKRLFGETAKRYGRDSIRKMRTTEYTERMAKLIRSPTALEDLKATVSSGQFAQIERELLEYLRSLNAERANAAYREIRPYLSPDAQFVSQEILDSKIPRSQPGRRDQLRQKIRDTIYDDLTRSSLTGERPRKVLDLWRTPEGQKIIKHELENNPNKKQIIDYLSEQSLSDLVETVTKDGKLDLNKFNDLMKSKNVQENIRLIGGDDAVSFFQELKKTAEKITKKLDFFERADEITRKGRIAKSTKNERAETQKAQEKVGDFLLKKIAENQKKLGKTETISKNIIGEEAILARNSNNAANTIAGTQRLGQMARKDQPLRFLMDDFFQSLGLKPAAFFALMGISHFKTAGGSYIGYQLFKRIARSKKLRSSIRKAANGDNSKANLSALISIFEQIKDEL